MKSNSKLYILTECAVMTALATVLSLIKYSPFTLGGSITLLSMLPIIIIGLRHGPVWGFASSFLYSVIQLVLDLGTVAYVPTPVGIALCVLFDYTLAFSSLGVAGFFRIKPDDFGTKKIPYVKAFSAVAIACVLRFICHFISGVVVWYEITKAGGWNDYVQTVGMYTYSFVYNISYFGPETALTLCGVPIAVIVLKHAGKIKK